MTREGKLFLFHTIRRDFIDILTNVPMNYRLEVKQPPWFSALANFRIPERTTMTTKSSLD